VIAALKRQIKATGSTLDLQRQLFQQQQQLKDLRQQQRKAGGRPPFWDATWTPAPKFAKAAAPALVVPTMPMAFAGAHGAPVGGVTINGGVNLYGIQDVPQLEDELLKRAGSRPQTRRGN
jgi:hypothetical protein